MNDVDVLEYLVIRKEFLNFLSETNGVVFDAHRAFVLLLETQREEQARLDELRDIDQDFPTRRHALLSATNKHMMKRNVEGGSNRVFVGNYCIVTIYHYWEENIRPRIAEVFGVEPNEVIHPILGEIRSLRASIIHHRSRATREVAKSKLFRWFKKDDPIAIDKEKFAAISQVLFGAILDHDLIPEPEREVAEFLRAHYPDS